MTDGTPRWQQRLLNYRRALAQLDEAITPIQASELSLLEKQGVIQALGSCLEPCRNTLENRTTTLQQRATALQVSEPQN